MKKCNLFFESRISILALPLRQPRRTTTTSSSILARSTVTSTTATTSPRPQVFSSSHRSLSRPRRPFRHEMPTSLPSTTTTTTLACIRPSRLQLRLLTLLLTGVTSSVWVLSIRLRRASLWASTTGFRPASRNQISLWMNWTPSKTKIHHISHTFKSQADSFCSL